MFSIFQREAERRVDALDSKHELGEVRKQVIDAIALHIEREGKALDLEWSPYSEKACQARRTLEDDLDRRLKEIMSEKLFNEFFPHPLIHRNRIYLRSPIAKHGSGEPCPIEQRIAEALMEIKDEFPNACFTRALRVLREIKEWEDSQSRPTTLVYIYKGRKGIILHWIKRGVFVEIMDHETDVMNVEKKYTKGGKPEYNRSVRTVHAMDELLIMLRHDLQVNK